MISEGQQQKKKQILEQIFIAISILNLLYSKCISNKLLLKLQFRCIMKNVYTFFIEITILDIQSSKFIQNKTYIGHVYIFFLVTDIITSSSHRFALVVAPLSFLCYVRIGCLIWTSMPRFKLIKNERRFLSLVFQCL